MKITCDAEELLSFVGHLAEVVRFNGEALRLDSCPKDWATSRFSLRSEGDGELVVSLVPSDALLAFAHNLLRTDCMPVQVGVSSTQSRRNYQYH